MSIVDSFRTFVNIGLKAWLAYNELIMICALFEMSYSLIASQLVQTWSLIVEEDAIF